MSQRSSSARAASLNRSPRSRRTARRNSIATTTRRPYATERETVQSATGGATPGGALRKRPQVAGPFAGGPGTIDVNDELIAFDDELIDQFEIFVGGGARQRVEFVKRTGIFQVPDEPLDARGHAGRRRGDR